MGKRDEYLGNQKILRLATSGPDGTPHVVPVWYLYDGEKFQIGTNSRTAKARNVGRSGRAACCVDSGTNAPGIYGVMASGAARLVVGGQEVRGIAEKILLRYFGTLEGSSAQELLKETDCIIEVTPEKFTVWEY